MAHKTLIGGTAYEVTGGRTLVSGTGYDIAIGKTLVGGTGYDVPFAEKDTFTLHIYDPYTYEEATEEYTYEVGMTWGEFIKSKYNTNDDFRRNGTRVLYGNSDVYTYVVDEFETSTLTTDIINYYTDQYGLKEYDKEDIEYRTYSTTYFD